MLSNNALARPCCAGGSRLTAALAPWPAAKHDS